MKIFRQPKTLGVVWIAETDVFTFNTRPPPTDLPLTKRNALKNVAPLFDPLGLVTPYTIRATILLQTMWTRELDWDEGIGRDLTEQVQQWFSELDHLKKVQVHRCLQPSTGPAETTIHTFIHTSKDAFGGVSYVRNTQLDGVMETRFIASKTKVAPLATMSIPRLELYVAVMGLRLAQSVSKTAVDYGRPFITIQGRGKERLKRWLRLFTCLASRAIHCEMAFGLDTDSCLNAFARMAYRRGLPQEVVSDRDTNFVSANRELKELVEKLDKVKICQRTANRGVTWIFNPPQAPHFGGAHEIMIKAAKKAIHAVLGEANVIDEELMTAFIGAESLLDSRRITYQTANPCDKTPLTPNHFLYGQVGDICP
ncbi:hypothetical protein AWC38_SpisGene19602 [Stylophora pistillata]|uniref:Integrase catalytic domain-containing protein n=1 Tax=Stylophora pistillata TaxID=50429 RepID=A0A2B4RIP7_STYPI|nr:hypothetical protein AWC38_SpisGene19602 [Stylophora pistillata]